MTSVLKIRGKTGTSSILIGESLGNLKSYLPEKNAVIITDTNVNRFYAKDFPPGEVLEIGTGETIKDLDTVRDLYAALLKLEADRSCFIVGIGGGVVCDIAGFVASTYLRGVRFGFVSSTLLSQVDASVGGKNGVNFDGYKNMIGVFRQPEFVICDIDLLKTLPSAELLCGFSEVLKHAAIGNPELFSYLEENHEKALGLDGGVMERLLCDSLIIKSSIVNRDERESGERRKLNFGHTFGHAIEKTTGASHGEAVSTGMVMASLLSERKGYLRSGAVERVEALLMKLKLPTRVRLDKKAILDAVKKDKKRRMDKIHFVFLAGIGNAVVEEISFRELEDLVNDMNWPWM
jgi:3-dehydroquinate synthase